MTDLKDYVKWAMENKRGNEVIPKYCKCNLLIEILVELLGEYDDDKLYRHIEKLKELKSK